MLIKFVLNHTHNATDIIEEQENTLLTSSRNFSNLLGKIIFNNLNDELKSLIKSLCESQLNCTIGIINTN